MNVATNDFYYLKDAANPLADNPIETNVFEGKSTKSYLILKNDKVIFNVLSDDTGPVQCNLNILKKAIKVHEKKIRDLRNEKK